MSSAHGARGRTSGAEICGFAGAKEKKSRIDASSARVLAGITHRSDANTAPAAALVRLDLLNIGVTNTFGLTARMGCRAETRRPHLLGIFEQCARSIAVVTRLPRFGAPVEIFLRDIHLEN